ncbi:hypothetical protein GCM10011571_11340 [Marinithermofilum abyssi]|jgi:hypothetical protein|uniref:Uncharacterized protein n=1 Tax=Marinithermofilum abyssi TaxID=1571185 RepID=A0A8J2VFR9_9BACL|nr:hypothetical protein [Marinithermofilum abyssi]GGE11694.1 hypothetical protein GCM10011571_11340 [Marinithermofilum abyssi]
MDASFPSPDLSDMLLRHFSEEELKRIQAAVQTETWMTLSTRNRGWNAREAAEEIPLRFQLHIDMKV